ncbi:hypothetical protein Tco_1321296 [Tanacetum coccineum]
MASNPEQVRLNVLTKLQEALDEEAILEEQILALMHRFADRFTDRRVEINNLMVLHDHPLIEYGKYALGCMTGADMKKCVYLKSVRDELLRSMEEKRQLMTNYRDIGGGVSGGGDSGGEGNIRKFLGLLSLGADGGENLRTVRKIGYVVRIGKDGDGGGGGGDSILLVKLKDIDSMSNMYTICRNEGFSELNIHHVVDERILWIEIIGLPLCAWGSNAYKNIACCFGKFLFFEKEDSSTFSSGRVCISSKSHGLIYENVQVKINNELFEATVQEIGSWCIKITDDYIDLSSNDNIKDVDTSFESIDDHSVDDLEYIQTNLNNIVNQVSKQKMDNYEENKQGEEDIHLIVPQ